MAEQEQNFDLETLRTDPQMWTRLATPNKKNAMENVFPGTENPFENDDDAAMEKVQKLASEGKLYMRDFGRGNHYRQVEQDGDQTKLGESTEQKTERYNDRFLGLLLNASGAYFRWIGLGRVAAWFDRRAYNHAQKTARDNTHNDEYKSLDKEQKEQLKKLRKQEKLEEKARKKIAKLEKEIKQARKELSEALGEDKPVEKGETDAPLTQPPKIEEDKGTMQPVRLGDDLQPQHQIDLSFSNEPTETSPEKPNEEPEIIDQQNAPKADSKDPEVEFPAPINQPPKLEEEKVAAQPKEETLEERLAAEKIRMDGVKNWKDRLTNTLFSHEEGADMKSEYDLVKDDSQVASIYLTTAAFSVMAQANAQNKPNVLEGLISGKSLGSEYDAQIRSGVDNAKQICEQNAIGNGRPLADLLAGAVRELSGLASQEPRLSERHVMIGRMISNAMGIAEANELTLPLKEEELAAAKGAVNLARISMSYHDARQQLGSGQLDLTSEKGAAAVRDLLMGNSVNMMIKQDRLSGDKINSCQTLMGTGIWSEQNLAQMTNNSKVRRGIEPNQVQKILEKPDSSLAHKAAKSVIDEVIVETEEIYKAQISGKERAIEREQNQPAINPMHT